MRHTWYDNCNELVSQRIETKSSAGIFDNKHITESPTYMGNNRIFINKQETKQFGHSHRTTCVDVRQTGKDNHKMAGTKARYFTITCGSGNSKELYNRTHFESHIFYLNLT